MIYCCCGCEFHDGNEVMIAQLHGMEKNERDGKRDEWKMNGKRVCYFRNGL